MDVLVQRLQYLLSPLLMYWRYCSLALNRRYNVIIIMEWYPENDPIQLRWRIGIPHKQWAECHIFYVISNLMWGEAYWLSSMLLDGDFLLRCTYVSFWILNIWWNVRITLLFARVHSKSKAWGHRWDQDKLFQRILKWENHQAHCRPSTDKKCVTRENGSSHYARILSKIVFHFLPI